MDCVGEPANPMDRSNGLAYCELLYCRPLAATARTEYCPPEAHCTTPGIAQIDTAMHGIRRIETNVESIAGDRHQSDMDVSEAGRTHPKSVPLGPVRIAGLHV